MACILKALQDASLRVWTDKGSLTPGTGWKNELENGAINAGCIVYLVSPESRQSVYVQGELALAERHHIPIFPVLVAGDESHIIFPYQTLQYIDARAAKLQTGILELLTAIFDELRRPILYRPLSALVNYLGPSWNSHGRAMIYWQEKPTQKLSLFAVYGIFLHDFLELEYTTRQGVVGQAWQNPDKVYLLPNWKKDRTPDLERGLKLNAPQLDAMSNLGLVAAIPVYSRSYLRPAPAEKVVVGVVTVDSPRAMDQLLTDGDSFIEFCLQQASELAILLDLKTGRYPLERIQC